ncbi:MAG: GTPase [Candidatus Altiarchaeota archaeon]
MFSELPYVPSASDLIDRSFRAGSNAARDVRGRNGPREKLLRLAEEKRVSIIGGIVEGELKAIIKQFPSYDQLPPFYQKLLDIQISKDKFKKSLGAADWALKNLKQLRASTNRRMRAQKETAFAKQYLGRVSSIIKQISGDLDILIEIKQQLQSFPLIRDDEPTLVVAGYPNAGKSTFLRNLTGSKVQIAAYHFTTTKIQVGRKKILHTTYQVIDVPGLLDRPMEKRNIVEQQAMLALEEVADKILFLIDPEQNLNPQMSLLSEVKEKFNVPIFVAINKVDAVEKSIIKEIEANFSKLKIIRLSAINTSQCEETFKTIIS